MRKPTEWCASASTRHPDATERRFHRKHVCRDTKNYPPELQIRECRQRPQQPLGAEPIRTPKGRIGECMRNISGEPPLVPQVPRTRGGSGLLLPALVPSRGKRFRPPDNSASASVKA